MRSKYTFAFPAFVLCWLLVARNCRAQASVAGNEHDGSHPYIAWVSMFPEKSDHEIKKSTARRIFEFLSRKNIRTNNLVRPVAVLADDREHYWVLDQGCETVFRMQNDKLEMPRSLKDKENYFTSLVGAAYLPGGNVLFTDSRLNKVFVIKHGEKKIDALNDTLRLDQPTGIAYSSVTHQIWVVETNAHRISILDSGGALIKRIGGRGDDNGQFNFPTSICIDKIGDAYVVDAMNFRVQIFNKDGVFINTFGEEGDGSGSFARAKGIAVDSYGNIYIADALFHVVQIFDRAGDFLYSFGKQGKDKEEFWMPAGIFIDSRNYIYVADSYNSRVQIFQLINGG